jgi:hypothetical protein
VTAAALMARPAVPAATASQESRSASTEG